MEEKKNNPSSKHNQEQNYTYEFAEGAEALRRMLEDYYTQHPELPYPSWLKKSEQKNDG